MIEWDLSIPLHAVANAVAIATRSCDGERANCASKGDTPVHAEAEAESEATEIGIRRQNNVTGREGKAAVMRSQLPAGGYLG